ncbi:hypothetical protein ACWEF9_11110 [Streptomyces sp. NPDC004980]
MMTAEHVRPWPVVGWRDIVHAFRPDNPATEAKLRTLRTNDVLSSGIRYTRHSGHRLAGVGTLYSRLSVTAAVLFRRSQAGSAACREQASAYGERASAIEKELSRMLDAKQLDHSAIEPLSRLTPAAAEVLRWVHERSEEALEDLPAVPGEEVTAGFLHSTDGTKVRFREVGEAGVDQFLHYGILESAGLSIGDPALVVSEFTGASIITRLQPGWLCAVPGPDGDQPAHETPDWVGRSLGSDSYRAALFDQLRSEGPNRP